MCRLALSIHSESNLIIFLWQVLFPKLEHPGSPLKLNKFRLSLISQNSTHPSTVSNTPSTMYTSPKLFISEHTLKAHHVCIHSNPRVILQALQPTVVCRRGSSQE